MLHHGVDHRGPYFSMGPHGRRHHYRTLAGMERARHMALSGGFLQAGARHRRVGRPRVHHRRRHLY